MRAFCPGIIRPGRGAHCVAVQWRAGPAAEAREEGDPPAFVRGLSGAGEGPAARRRIVRRSPGGGPPPAGFCPGIIRPGRGALCVSLKKITPKLPKNRPQIAKKSPKITQNLSRTGYFFYVFVWRGPGPSRGYFHKSRGGGGWGKPHKRNRKTAESESLLRRD